MPHLQVDTSVVKRRTEDFSKVKRELEEAGFKKTGEGPSDRVIYFEDSMGVGLTAVNGPKGVLVFPSGPVRGKLFSEDAVGVSFVEKARNKTSTETKTDTRGRTTSTEHIA